MRFMQLRLAQRAKWILALLMSLALLAGCSGGSGDGPVASESEGEVIIGLTDAEGDFLSYTVDVLSLKLTRQDGAVVETLPLTTRVDFAQYTELTEFLTAATVPAGVYTDVSMLVDYADAQIVVQGENGEALDAVAKDSGGAALGELTMDVQLSDRDTFRIAPGIPAHITLDFDLDASNTIDLSTDPVDVIVDPVLIADTLLEDPKSHRLRGLLNAVSVDAGTFSVNIRPFHRRDGRFGSVRVISLDDTAYEINGVGFNSEEGLKELATLPTSTAIVVLGELNRRDRGFEAEQVFAGTSVPWGDDDLLTGHIVARDGDVLTVRGATIVRSNDSAIFNDEVMVTIGPDTHVTRQGAPDGAFDTDDLSVGQRVDVIGELTETSPGELEMDATAGHVRMRYTTLRASVVQSSPLVVELQRIDRRRISLFNFSGTGLNEDANPDEYEIDTGDLSLSGITDGEPVKIRGFVNEFGMAPPDFSAQTVLSVKALPAFMAIHWINDGTTAPFASQSSSELVVNLRADELGRLHHVFRAGVGTDLLTLGANPTIQPATDRRGLYAIAQNRRVQVFTDFESFEAELASRLDGATKLDRLHGRGDFEDAQALLTTHRMSVHLN